MMYVRFEYMDKAVATIIKGKSLHAPDAMYEDVGAGTVFTGTAGVNFWLLFEATSQSSGEFVFTLWFKETSGEGQEHLPAIGAEVEEEEEPESVSVFGNDDEICLNDCEEIDSELSFPDQ
jgi:hypothetical protein